MNKLLKWNAEFAKNIWLEISIQRLIAMPAIILLIIILIYSNANQSATNVVNYVSLIGFIFIGMLWGIKSASNSIIDEYNDKTWDWQKMSIIGAWKLVIGKLFGSTIYNWYGAIICLIIYLYTCLGLGTFSEGIINVLLLILTMISLHGIIILMALQLIKKADGRSKVKSNRILIVSFLFFAFLSNFIGLNIFNKTQFNPTISWFGFPISMLSSAFMCSIFYCFWIIAGLYRSMRAELQFSDAPNWWFAFIISNFVFQLGFFFGYDGLPIKASLLIGFAIYFVQLIFLNYFLAFTEGKDIVNFKTLQLAYTEKNWKSFLKNAPLWLLTLPISFLFGLIVVLLFILVGQKEITNDIENHFQFNLTGISIAFLISIFCFIIRDFGVMLLLHFSPKAKRANTTLFFYFMLMYFILPMLLGNSENISAAFFPTADAPPIIMVGIPLLEAVIVLYFLAKRWKEINRESLT